MRRILLVILGIGMGFFWSAEILSETPEEPADQLRRIAGVEKVRRKKAYRIAVGDKVRVKIYPEDEYVKGGEMEVSSEGTITLPLIGKIRVEGMRVSEAERGIVDLLSKDYLVSPVVVIEAAEPAAAEEEKASVAILGQVKKPGTYVIPTDGKLTLLQVISLAGGFTDVANVKKIKVIRKGKDRTRVIRANAEAIISGNAPDIELQAEDVVHVGESFF